jgi:hypothetical protein
MKDNINMDSTITGTINAGFICYVAPATPLKTVGELRCSGRVAVSVPRVALVMLL